MCNENGERKKTKMEVVQTDTQKRGRKRRS